MRQIILLLLLAGVAGKISAADLEDHLTANFIGLGIRDVETTTFALQVCHPGTSQYKFIEANQIIRAAGRAPARIRLIGYAGVFSGYLAIKLTPKRYRIATMLILNIAETWALSTWGKDARLQI